MREVPGSIPEAAHVSLAPLSKSTTYDTGPHIHRNRASDTRPCASWVRVSLGNNNHSDERWSMGGGGGMDAPSLRTSVEAPRGSRSPEPQKKKLGDKPRNIDNYAYWCDVPIVALSSMRLLLPIGCLV